MPFAIFQLEQRLEPFVEWFHGLAAATADRLAAAAAIELSAVESPAMRLITRFDRLAPRLVFRAPLTLRTQEEATRAPAIRREFEEANVIHCRGPAGDSQANRTSLSGSGKTLTIDKLLHGDFATHKLVQSVKQLTTIPLFFGSFNSSIPSMFPLKNGSIS